MNLKSELSQAFCVRKLKILADTTRLAVLETLMEGSKHVKELNAVLIQAAHWVNSIPIRAYSKLISDD